MTYEAITLAEVMPVIKPGTRGLCHIGSYTLSLLDAFDVLALGRLLADAAEKANVELITKNVNKMLMIGWTPK